ncbi:MAG: HAD-IA family hydrolase [Pseudomonadota bacterium]
MRLTTLLLDLDGTLVDTAPDMVATLNRLRADQDLQSVDYEQAALQVSSGARALVRLGFGADLAIEEEERLIAKFLEYYAEETCVHSKLYPHMPELLTEWEGLGRSWGVITNKPLSLAKSVLEGLGILERCKVLLGGDSLPVKKPDPVPLLHSAMLLTVAPSECLYVGDHRRDIDAAKNAGMQSGVADWGYIETGENSHDWGADFVFTSPAGLAKFLFSNS